MDDSNNWLSSIPLSPAHSSLLPHFQESQSHNQFSLGTLVDENMESLFQNHDWNLFDSHSNNENPNVADFLGVRSSENQSDLVALNEIQSYDFDYLFTNNSIAAMPMQNSEAATNSSNYEYQENNSNNNMQPLTLSIGISGNKDSTNKKSGDNSTNNDVEAASRRTLHNSSQRKSIYRGVTRHISTGRYEAHLWDSSIRKEGQSKKGYQVYLGGYDTEEKAARAYDLVALKYWGESTTTNFPIGNYKKELEEMKDMTRQDFVATIRRSSSGFSRGASMYRGVTRHNQEGKWQAKLGRVGGEKDLYLGTFSTEEDAAKAYDMAAIKFRGPNAMTNFDISHYDVKAIIESNTLSIRGGASSKRLKETRALESSRKKEEMTTLGSSSKVEGGGYPLLQQRHQFDQPRSSITLQNQDQYNNNHPYHSSYSLSYVQTQIELHKQQQSGSYNGDEIHNNQLQTHPALVQGYMNIGSSSSSSVMDNSGGGGSSHGSYNRAGFIGNNNGLVGMSSNSSSSVNNGGGGSNNGLVGMASNSSSSEADELSLMVDYDIASKGYSGWLIDSMNASNG